MFLAYKSALRLEEPARPSAVLAVAGAGARTRKLIQLQARLFPSIAIYHNDEVLAVAFFQKHSCKRLEFALAFSPVAHKHMRALIKIAHLTLDKIAQSHVIIASIAPQNRQGQRMAELTGFFRSRVGRKFWIFAKGY